MTWCFPKGISSQPAGCGADTGVCWLQAAARVKHYAMDSAIQAQQAAAEAARKQANQVLSADAKLRVLGRYLPEMLGAAI